MSYEDDKNELELALMNAQIEKLNIERDKLKAEAERFRQEMKWEPYKAVAAIAVGIAAAAGGIVAFATWLAPRLHG